MPAARYEWDIETIETGPGADQNDPEILDHHFFSTCPAIPIAADRRLVLVRDHDRDGRAWAYVTGGTLPGEFRDAYDKPVAPVPQRFRDQLARTTTA